MPQTPPEAFNCQRCGYEVGSIDLTGKCPECGEPIEHSIPRIRDGSPWQQKRSLANLIRTYWMFFAHPAASWDSVRIEKPSALSLIGWGIMLGLLLVNLPVLAIYLFISIINQEPRIILVVLVYCGILSVVFVIGLFLYAGIAVLRMKFWSRNRQWMIGSEHAWTIIGHASFGLFLILILICSGFLSFLAAALINEMLSKTNIESYVPVSLLISLGYILIIASIPAGLIVFEVLSSIGMRRLKFRNMHPSEKPDSLSRPHHAGQSQTHDSGMRMDIS